MSAIDCNPFPRSPQAAGPLQEKLTFSAVMAVESLREQVAATQDAQAQYESERQVRDELISSARDAGIPVAALMRATALSRDRISKIHTAQKGMK
ncbi:hypothetical protein OVN18_09505 [Microcella daejeonensis]|uniref:Uncharacterized protein n=1 Tax=Microcella daejeonensis TaxID=2994971 RepID=A0A9E8MJQ0_9MICO|nr:hypothetical protein [Microcella daejeonensis]WAB80801.1 hypothetical protein OVN18_09505 [Microcella daejeonensis]